MKLLKPLMLCLGLIGTTAYANTCDELAASPKDATKPASIQGIE